MYSLNKIIKTISFIALTLGCFGLSPQAQAVCQEGCLTNFNTALGEDALLNNAFGFGNTAVGFDALLGNTTGSNNTATGFTALLGNSTGVQNTATGVSALKVNTTGSNNTATGFGALLLNTTGNANTALGEDALFNNTTGSNNVVEGAFALSDNINGNSNTAIGANALAHGNGDNNIALGNGAGMNLSGDANIAIGNRGVRNESGTIRIGQAGIHTNTYIAGISGVTVAGGVGVIIDTDGHLGTIVSSERFKDAVRPMDKASEAILSLKPVTFRYKTALDPKGIPQFGLVAEQVEKVNPDLVARDAEGKPYSVRYEAVNAMLLNEFLKEHRRGQEQDATIAQLKSALAQQQQEIQTLTASLKAQSAQIQEVTRLRRVGVSRPAPRLVADSQ